MKWAGVIGLALLVVSMLGASLTPVTATTTPKILVQTTDQYGNAFDHVQVEILSQNGSSDSSGITSNGFFLSASLAGHTTYTVLVSTGTQFESKNVTLVSTDATVSFVLFRPAPQSPKLVVASVILAPTLVTPGSEFLVTLTIDNTGNLTSYGSTISVTPNSPIFLVGNSGVAYLGVLKPGNTATATFSMDSIATASSESVTVAFVTSYTDPLGNSFNDSGAFTISLTSTPNMKVNSFNLSVNPIHPGVASILTLSLINAGGDRAYNVRVTASGKPFLPGNSTSYLGSVPIGATPTSTFYLSVANGTAPGSYDLNLSISYTDIRGQTYTSTNAYQLSVEPYLPPSVSVTNALLDPLVLNPGTQGTLTIFLKNTGTTEADNVHVTISGGDQILTSNFFGVGTMLPGDKVTQQVGINVAPKIQTGSYLLTLNVAYTDPSGTTYHSSVPLQTGVYGSSSLFTLTSLLIAGGIAVAILLGLILLRRFKFL